MYKSSALSQVSVLNLGRELNTKWLQECQDTSFFFFVFTELWCERLGG